jgi:hypothetical protein
MKPNTKKTQQLFCLNELSKETNLNIFEDIIFGEKIVLFTKYNHDYIQKCKNKYGKPRTNFHDMHMDIIFETEVFILTFTAEIIK